MNKIRFDEILVAVASGKPVAFDDIPPSGVDINAFGLRVARTLLMAAAYAGRDDLVRGLVSKGASVDLLNENGMAAIHEAAMVGHATTSKYCMS